MRATTKRRNGRVPELGRRRNPGAQGTSSLSKDARAGIRVPGVDLEPHGKKPRPLVGRPSGPDGRAPQRSYAVSGFSALVSKEIRDREWTEKVAHGWVMGNWESLVGAKIAQHTRVEMIKEGTVFISCDQTAWATNLKYMQGTILAAIADKIGPDVITTLHIYPPKTKSWRYGPLHVKGRGPRDTYG
nr:DciA family protein [Corynebacterium aquatimens]